MTTGVHDPGEGPVERLKASLAGAQEKLAQLDATQSRQGIGVDLGMPTFVQIATRTSDAKAP